MSKPSKFTSLIEAAKEGPEPIGDPTVETPAAEAAPSPPAAITPPALPREGEARGRGRPKGKRSDPDFEQVSARIPSRLYDRVKIGIIEDGRRQDFSELVAELLSGWLDKRSAK